MHGCLETVRIENLKKKLHVMIIAPGFTATEIRKHALVADGSEQGESPKNEDKLMSPKYVAKWVLKGIRKRKRNNIRHGMAGSQPLLQRMCPRWSTGLFIEMSRESSFSS
jgi:short-subunit dehydrogenase